ncbi:MAG: Asp-tRNA(Asn)/Glu-tRNA(Gln) amidotransferase subunit GatC [Nanoarchaeota archaeon]
MKVDKELVRNVASVARLRLTNEEIEKFAPQLKEILDAFSKLDEVDTDNVIPSFQPVELKNVMRDDKVGESLSQEKALKNTIHKKDGYFKGPKVVS